MQLVVPWAAGGLTALLVAMFPANVYAAVKPISPFDNPVLGYGRLPLQIPLVLGALYVARGSNEPEPRG